MVFEAGYVVTVGNGYFSRIQTETGSPFLENRLAFLDEGADRLLVIGGARGLYEPLGFAVQRGGIIDMQRVVEIVLHVAQRHARALGQRSGKREGLVLQSGIVHDAIHQPDALASL